MSEEITSPTIKVGILDSGVGGLSVLREIHQLLPELPVHYVGDSSWCPYGNKVPEVITKRVFQITDYLIEKGAGLIVIACNSATIHSVGPLRATYPLPIVGMEPGIKPAAEQTSTGVVGVLATEASIAGEKFHQLVDNHAEGVTIITRPCPKFVELVEDGTLEGPVAMAAVEEALAPLLEAGADTVVLGCTHYPFLGDVIRSQLPTDAALIDTGQAVARRVRSLLPECPKADSEADIQIETTGSLEHLDEILPKLLPDIRAKTSFCAL